MKQLSPAAYFDILGQAQKAYSKQLEPVCREWNLTRNELDVMLFLANNPGFDRAADIVAVRKIAKSHVSLSVSNLEKRGLLVRVFEEGDRRAAHLRLTDAAHPIVRVGQHLQKQFFTKMFDGLSRKELQLWGAVLEKICKNIESMDF